MDSKRFKQIDLLLGIVVFFVAAFTYLSTIEPTASFWDCGEFIASSYKLEVGHPPGNPTFQVIARIFTLFGGNQQAAMLVNAMSALCSAATILFLFWSITHLGRRIWERKKESLTLGEAIAILVAGTVGALSYTFSDTFWFSAVEAEVYAMSSLFTAAVVWAMLKWEEEADKPYANRWIVLIAYLMGLSIGVHLLNLLTIPALVFVYYYKKYTFSWKGVGYTTILSIIILAVVLFGIIPWVPRVASWFDLLFVNGFGLKFNSGVAFFMVALFTLSFWGIYYTYKKNKVLLNTILLCFAVILVGYSSFAVIIIRSSANTPTNENQPDNPFSLMSYLARDQYGSAPLLYGQTFVSQLISVEPTTQYVKMGNKYKRVKASSNKAKVEYDSNTKMFFPRMWSNGQPNHPELYQQYTKGRGKSVPGQVEKVPYFRDNIRFFFDYQVNWMYMRYFMWNFVGRQNDFHGGRPGDLIRGNWESGIGFIDRMRLGDQREGPDFLVHNKAKNHFYFLPLILGLIGLFYQYAKDRRNTWIVFLLFFLTGLAVVLYLNQPPDQPRERDYAYAGSFYAFTIWMGLGVMSLYEFLRKKKLSEIVSVSIAGALCLFVPIQMGSQTWDDHDRSHRYTVTDLGYNYLMSCGEQAILVTVGDNDTFPLWYMQEVEGVRTDVRILNTSLLGTDWYIDQMQYQMYESKPLPFSLPRELYVGGVNDGLYIDDMTGGGAISLRTAMNFVANPEARRYLSNGELVDILPARKFLIPVNKENVKKYGIVNPNHLDRVLDTIEISISPGRDLLHKHEMMILNLLGNYQWDRPIHFTSMGADLKMGLEKYLQFDGFTYKLVPILCNNGPVSSSQIDTDLMYDRIMNVYRWDSFSDRRIHVDYQNLLTFQAVLSLRGIFTQIASALFDEGKIEQAVEVLDKMQEVLVPEMFPLNTSVLGWFYSSFFVLEAVNIYVSAGETEKAEKLSDALVEETMKTLAFYGRMRLFRDSDMETNVMFIYELIDRVETFNAEKAEAYGQRLRDWGKGAL